MSVELRGARVLVVDDESVVREVISRGLGMLGIEVTLARDAEEALEKANGTRFDAVLTDISMPGITGIELLKQLKARDADTPVLIMTAHADLETAREAVRSEAEDYLVKPFNLSDMEISLRRGIEKRRLVDQNREYQQRLEAMVDDRTRELRKAMQQLERSLVENRKAHLESIIVLSKVAEVNDEDTGNHIKRVSLYCRAIGYELALPSDDVERIAYSAPMHDIGKISVDPRILRKKGKLTREEFDEIKKHAQRGAEILESVPFLGIAREIALCHHERFDGSGYPRGLRCDQIPVSARVVAVADVFDALTSARCYKPAFPEAEAFAYIEQEAGRHFHPDIVNAFTRAGDEIRHIRRDLAEPDQPPPTPGPIPPPASDPGAG